MLSNTGPVAKLYLSIIDDVIESMRELFLEEGLEDRVLDDLRHLWESKMMQSKAMEDFKKNSMNTSGFVLQLPDSYSQTDPDLTASVVIPASQNIHSFTAKTSIIKSNSETIATFSLPAGLTYPVQIPAGVTLQTASGHLYKVNVPVVVTQAPAGQQPVSHPKHKAPAPTSTAHPQQVEPFPVPVPGVTQQPQPDTPPSPGVSPQQQPQCPDPSQLHDVCPPPPEVTPGEEEPTQQQQQQLEAENFSLPGSPCSRLLDFQLKAEEALMQAGQLNTRDIDDILKEVIEEERGKAERLDLDYSYGELSDIVQLDGPADDSDVELEDGVAVEENDFLGMINAEAIKALEEGDGSSDGLSISSSSDSEGADKLTNAEEEDPLNSGDDVIEQDIPDLFDTDNVIVCQYDKIHRSKNRWKFHLKDGVMCYGGRDFVFSKAVGEAEW